MPTVAASPYKLLICDLDGTLVDTVGDIADALNAALSNASHGARHDDAAVRAMIGEGAHELMKKASAWEVGAKLDGLTADFLARYSARLVARTVPYPGVVDALTKITSKIPAAVATNKPGGHSREILDRLNLSRFFFRVLGADDVARRKPDPEMVHAILAEAKVAPKDALYVGDSLIDAETARAAGVDLCLVSYGYADRVRLDAAPARHRIDAFSDLLKAVVID